MAKTDLIEIFPEKIKYINDKFEILKDLARLPKCLICGDRIK